MSQLDEKFTSANEDLRTSRLFFSARKDEYCSEGIIGTLPGIINYAIRTLTWVPGSTTIHNSEGMIMTLSGTLNSVWDTQYIAVEG